MIEPYFKKTLYNKRVQSLNAIYSNKYKFMYLGEDVINTRYIKVFHKN